MFAKWREVLAVTLLVVVLVLLFVVLAQLLHSNDWYDYFRPAALSILSGEELYGTGYFNPPWIAVMLVPIVLLPKPYDGAMFSTMTFLAFVAFAYRMKFKPVSILFFAVNPLIIMTIRDGNIDGLVLLGATLAPPIGLFLVLAKPQVGLIVATLWFFQCVRSDKPVRRTVLTFSPVAVALLISFAVYGLWPITVSSLNNVPWNASVWPIGIPVGLLLTAFAVKQNDKSSAISASPFLSNYVGIQSWATPLVLLGQNPKGMGAITIILWLGLILLAT